MPVYEFVCPNCDLHIEHFMTMSAYDSHNAAPCPECNSTMWIKPSFSRSTVAEAVVQARKDKEPEISSHKARTDLNYARETAKRQAAAQRIERTRDARRHREWKSKTFIPGGGVLTRLPKNLEPMEKT